MKQISALDLHYFLRELEIFKEQRIDNFYFENGVFYIRVYVRTKGHLYITNKVSEYIYFDDKKENATEPNNFIQYLRKYIKNGIIQNISQIPNERIIKIEISKKEEGNIKTYNLYLELFANGNIVICDEDNIIKNSLEKRKFKDRDILVNREYELPPKRDLSIYDIDIGKFKEEAKDSDLKLVKFIAIKFGLGGKFSEEVCHLSKLDKNKQISELSDSDFSKLVEILNIIPKKGIKPYIILKEDKLFDFIPFKFESIEESVLSSRNTFNDCLRDYYSNFIDDTDKREEEFKKELKKLEKRLEKLDEQKNQIEKDYEEFNSAGNKIYENYALIEDLLNSINNAAKDKGWDYVKEKIKSEKKLSKIIKKLDYKNNQLIIEI